MMIYYVVFGLMYKKINKIFLFAIVTAISLLANLVQNAMKVNMPDQIYKLLYLSIFFYTGIIAEKYIVKLKLAHSIMCGVIGLTMGGYFGREDYIESIPIVNVIIAWLMICSFVGIAKNSNINIRLLIYYGKNSLPIYLLHLFFVTSVTVVMHKIGMGGIVGLIITVLIGINGSISIMCCAKKVGIYEILFTPGKVLLK
jgi:peptidoglycan/LPS O-acetylase OafA/YrhL